MAIRGWLGPHDLPSVTPASEAVPIQRLSQAGQMGDIGLFIDERVKAASSFLVRATDSTSAGIRWTSSEILTTSPVKSVIISRAPFPDSAAAAPRAAEDSLKRGWIVIVARDRDNRVLSLHDLIGGRTRTECRTGRTIEKFIIGVPLTSEFSGAGVFDLDGSLSGFVIQCADSSRVAVPLSEVTRLLSDSAAAQADTSAKTGQPPGA
ncbi:MAG: hypothetical protein ABIR58_05105 [Gemmatimonadaceae bacterium]